MAKSNEEILKAKREELAKTFLAAMLANPAMYVGKANIGSMIILSIAHADDFMLILNTKGN